jgi:hypothetical protein
MSFSNNFKKRKLYKKRQCYAKKKFMFENRSYLGEFGAELKKALARASGGLGGIV